MAEVHARSQVPGHAPASPTAQSVSGLVSDATNKVTAAATSAVDAVKNAASSISAPQPVYTKTHVHSKLGGDKVADILLWRNAYVSGGILGTVFMTYILFEWSGYTLLSLISNILLLLVITTFLWSYGAALLNRSPPPLPKLELSEELVGAVAKDFRVTVNRALKICHDVALGKDYVLFIKVVLSLYALSVVGSWFNLLTLVFLVVLFAFTLPKFYEQYDKEVDHYVNMASNEVNKYYQLVQEKVFNRIPRANAAKEKKAL